MVSSQIWEDRAVSGFSMLSYGKGGVGNYQNIDQWGEDLNIHLCLHYPSKWNDSQTLKQIQESKMFA